MTLRAGWVITQRSLARWVREPWTPIFGLLFMAMLLLVFGFLFGGAITVPGGGDYIDFLLPGMLALSMMFGVESTATAMATDSRRGITDRFRSLPIGSSSVALGRVGADMFNSVAELVVLIGGGLLIGWRITGGWASALVAVLLLLLFRFAVLWIGIFIGLSFRGDGATMAVQVLVWPIGFLSSAIVSAETMPAWLGAIATWNPLSATASATRQLFGSPTGLTEGGYAGEVWPAVVWPLVLVAIFVPLSARAYRRLRA